MTIRKENMLTRDSDKLAFIHCMPVSDIVPINSYNILAIARYIPKSFQVYE
jgi:hypothetical protein